MNPAPHQRNGETASETPEVDYHAQWANFTDTPDESVEIVDAAFARSLERRLASARMDEAARERADEFSKSPDPKERA